MKKAEEVALTAIALLAGPAMIHLSSPQTVQVSHQDQSMTTNYSLPPSIVVVCWSSGQHVRATYGRFFDLQNIRAGPFPPSDWHFNLLFSLCCVVRENMLMLLVGGCWLLARNAEEFDIT